jgi:hypothetical protein
MYLAKVETMWQGEKKATHHFYLIGEDRISLFSAARDKIEAEFKSEGCISSDWIVGHHLQEPTVAQKKINSYHYWVTMITNIGTYYCAIHIEIKETDVII